MYVVVSSLFKLLDILDPSTIFKKLNIIVITVYIDSCPWHFFKDVVLTKQTTALLIIILRNICICDFPHCHDKMISSQLKGTVYHGRKVMAVEI